ncbi:MAG TPA: transketolase [Dehalococcoidia bacterium]|nr:transketolase [Dehalococcoidia bacterium]
MDKVAFWNDLAAQLSVDSIRATTAAGSGHPTSSMSAAHLTAVLFADHLRYDPSQPKSLANDRFVLSKGHASPLLYSLFKALGVITDSELLSLRQFGSPLQGHPAPIPEMPWIDVATGSLGQGLPMGLGMALGMKLDAAPSRVWVLLGDSEVAEGSVWEAMQAASFHGLNNLTAILDMNRLGQRGPTMLQWDAAGYGERARAFGWNVVEIDGHDVQAIDTAYGAAEQADRPTLIVAHTIKGKGASLVEDKEGWHGKAMTPDQAKDAIAELGGERHTTITPPAPLEFRPPADGASPEPPAYSDGIATRKAYGETLASLAPRHDVVVLDAEVGNSTHTEDFGAVAPERFIQLYIAEQTMIGAAIGLNVVGKTAFAATFGAFMTRAYDFVRMAAVGRADLRLCGSHAGISIGEDGPSQMALEDLAMMRAVQGSTVLYPADGNATAHLVRTTADLAGISYVRTTREKTGQLYQPNESFPIGGSKTLRASDHDRVTLVGAGVTLYESLKAADELSASGIATRVIDAYSIKPIDVATLRKAIEETGLIVVTEDHWIEGGLGDAVLAALASDGRPLTGRVIKLGVREMPGSGKPEELRDWAGISASKIAAVARTALS